MKRTRMRLLLSAVLTLVAGSGTAGTVVVAGDENITNALVGNGGTSINPGDQQFFKNVLGGGTRVLVDGTDVSVNDSPVANTNTFYNTVSGVTSTIQSGPVTSAALAGVNLFVDAIPANAFSASEITALSVFSAGGGTIFLMGDAQNFAATQDANLNALLVGLGSPLRIVLDNLDSGFMTATGSHIATNPLTTGVTSFTYAFVSQVSGGTPLFFTSGGQTFIAVTTSSVPEPSAFIMAGTSASMGLGVWLRRRRPGSVRVC